MPSTHIPTRRATNAKYQSSPKGLANRNRYKAARRAFVDNLKTYPAKCVVCGMSGPPETMEWHHRPGTIKRFAIGRHCYNYSIAAILEEIAKCDLVCGNHHAMITSRRAIFV